MARKKAKGKKATQSASATRRTGTVKKAQKPVSKASPVRPESRGAIDLLRSWSPARYSSR